MNFPKSNIWQDLRTNCLGAIPSGSRSLQRQPFTLNKWQDEGAYIVTLAANKGYKITCSSIDIGSGLLGDVEHFLDHAAEHQVSIWKQINSDEWTSPAWLAVTFYYWSYFLAMSLTRLIGSSVWFLNRDITDKFKDLAAISSNPPGPGSFRLVCGPLISSNDREISIYKDGTRVHDDLWRLWFHTTGELLAKYPRGSASTLELRLFACFQRSSTFLGADWPSAIRNVVNYRPGFAYNTVRRIATLDNLRYVRDEGVNDVERVVDRFERNLATVRTSDDIVKSPKVVCKLLVDLTFLLHAITIELYSELLERNNIDQRWRAGRTQFLRQEGLQYNGKLWPI